MSLSPYPTAAQDGFGGLLGASDDDFDPEHDEWANCLDDEYVVEACRHHLDRCIKRNPTRHDY